MKGWMDKVTFEDIMKLTIIPEARRIRAMNGRSNERMLLLLDGHSSRMNRELWEHFREEKIDVIVIPAHTSHILQPLDLGVNAEFKRALEKVPPYPPKHEMARKLPEFFTGLDGAIYSALHPATIRHGFAESCILVQGKQAACSKCVEVVPECLLPKKKSLRFSISGELVTDPLFLKKWRQHEEGRKASVEELREVMEKSEWEKMSDESECEDGEIDEIGASGKKEEKTDTQLETLKQQLSESERDEEDPEEGDFVIYLRCYSQEADLPQTQIDTSTGDASIAITEEKGIELSPEDSEEEEDTDIGKEDGEYQEMGEEQFRRLPPGGSSHKRSSESATRLSRSYLPRRQEQKEKREEGEEEKTIEEEKEKEKGREIEKEDEKEEEEEKEKEKEREMKLEVKMEKEKERKTRSKLEREKENKKEIEKEKEKKKELEIENEKTKE
jgi:hypothetical protein